MRRKERKSSMIRRDLVIVALLIGCLIAVVLTISHTEIRAFADEVPSIETCDSTGTVKNMFFYGEDLYVKASGMPHGGGEYLVGAPLLVVEDVDWTDGMEIPPIVDECLFPPVIVWNSSGVVPPANISGFFEPPLCPGNYDIIIDWDSDNCYNSSVDLLDDGDIETAGFKVVLPSNVIPEVPVGTILASVAMIIALLGYVIIPKHRSKIL